MNSVKKSNDNDGPKHLMEILFATNHIFSKIHQELFFAKFL